MNSTDWLDRLSGEQASERDQAIIDLRAVLMKALRSAITGRYGSDDAFLEDMTQVSLLRVLERLDTFNGRSRFTSWAIAIAIRITFNELRRREWKNASLDALQEDGVIVEEAAEPSADVAVSELSQLIRDLIAEELTKRQRDVLFAELEGMPQEEIVRQLGGTRNSVYKLFHDARKALRQALERKGITSFDQIDLLADLSQKGTM